MEMKCVVETLRKALPLCLWKGWLRGCILWSCGQVQQSSKNGFSLCRNNPWLGSAKRKYQVGMSSLVFWFLNNVTKVQSLHFIRRKGMKLCADVVGEGMPCPYTVSFTPAIQMRP